MFIDEYSTSKGGRVLFENTEDWQKAYCCAGRYHKSCAAPPAEQQFQLVEVEDGGGGGRG